MNAMVIYDTEFGNTERIAKAIGQALEGEFTVRVQSIADQPAIPPELELLVIGGPTQMHGMSPRMRDFLKGLPEARLEGMQALAFDTRYRMMKLLAGSAAERIGKALRKKGVRLLAPPESFFVGRDVPPQGEKRRHELERLEPGEEERAAEWAASILERMGAAR
jgi:flavodoxin